MTTHGENIRIQDFLDIVADAVIMVDQQQKIVYINETAEAIWGYSTAEILGQPLHVLIPERFSADHKRHLEEFAASPDKKRNMAAQGEVSARKRDGSEFPIEASIAKITAGDELRFAIFLRDITARKQAEKELAKWAQAFEHAEWGMVVGEASTRNFQIMNPAFARMYGYTVEELTDLPIETVYAPAERGKIENWLRLAHQNGHITYESWHMRRDRTEFPVIVSITAVKDAHGEAIYRVVNVTDVSDLKKTELALREHQKQNASIIEALEEGILLMDREGCVLLCNASAEILMNIPKSQILGQRLFSNEWTVIHEDGSIFDPADYPSRVTLASGKVIKNLILGLDRPGIAVQWITVSSHPLYHNEEQEPYAALISFADVTERVQMVRIMEERIKESTRELSALLEVSRNLASTLDLPQLLKAILVQLKIGVDYTGAAVARLKEGEFIFLEYLGPVPREIMLKFRVSAEEDTGYRRVMTSMKPYIIHDMWKNDPWLNSLQQRTSSAIVEALKPAHSWMGVPLIAQNNLIGILRLDHNQANYFTQPHVEFITAFAELAAIAIQNADLYEQVQLNVAMEERQKLARELHDSISQVLYGIALGVKTARTLLDRDPASAAEPLDYCMTLAETGLAEIRALIFELRPESLEKEGLITALIKQADGLKARYHLDIELDLGAEPPVSIAIKETIYRIAQEGLNNIIKHAQATKTCIRLAWSGDQLLFEIEDNGQGFDPILEKPGHIGLTSMRERAQRIGATLSIMSKAGQGTLIQLFLKVPAK